MYLVFARTCDSCGGVMGFRLVDQAPTEFDIREVEKEIGDGSCIHSYIIDMSEVDEFDDTTKDIIVFTPEDI